MAAPDLARRLPSIAVVRALSQSFAVLDAVLSADGDATYAFDGRWAEDEELASMDNGSGDEYSIVFSPAGAFVRGFDHESPMSPYAGEDHELWPGLVESVPERFAGQAAEPAFSDEDGFLVATVCLWRLHDDPAWRTGDIEFPPEEESTDPDGSDRLFTLLAEGTPGAYCAYAADYFEVSPDPAAVKDVFEHRPLTDGLVRRLNPHVDLASLTEILGAIGYPVAGESA
ncbi:hypothetical protein E1281_12490 [Actinomadura sp. KC345]|uniref:hypothetical protein n=1 Tax=Actinomadura sp. KC345 TaxID=2530371 RepID=UPI00104ADCA9|nr:hypothetical protein [Actinomadura sp. KC345]TDC55467.1 hypothetical protein E1281_12490 [Actinomadura sp. KC345]